MTISDRGKTRTDRAHGRFSALVRRPLWQHGALLLALLAGVAGVIGTDSAFVTDESFVVIQLDTIEETGGWSLQHPFPNVDPGGSAFPLHGASRFEQGWTLYGKHPLLIYAYLPIHKLFGIAGLVAVSLAGTVGAALGAGAIANRLLPGSGMPALWLVGAGSPLFFDAFLVHAHTIAAALAGLSAYLALRLLDGRSMATGAGLVGGALLVALLRTEGIFFAAALGGCLGLVGVARRRGDLLVWGAAAMAAAPAAYLGDRWWARAVAPGDPLDVVPVPREQLAFLLSRFTSLSVTLFLPGYRGGGLAEMITAAGSILLIVGVLVMRRRPHDDGAILVPVCGAALLVLRALLQWGAVPGLLVAFPVGVAGLVLVSRVQLHSTSVRLLLGASAIFGLGVAATQYPSGGHTEWGGRYFALVIPLLGAIAAVGLVSWLQRLPERRARIVTGSLVASALALGVLAARTVESSHERNRQRSDRVLAAAAELDPGDGGRPVVVTEDDQIPRLARGRYSEVRFLRVVPEQLQGYLERLADQGIEELLLVSLDPGETLRALPDEYEVDGTIRPHALQWEGEGGLIRLRLTD